MDLPELEQKAKAEIESLRAQAVKIKAEALIVGGYVKGHLVIIAFAIGALLGFIAGHIK